MSVQVVRPGDLVRIGPSDKRAIAFDWDFENLPVGAAIVTSTFTVRALKQSGATALAYDLAGVLTEADATTALGRTVVGDDRVTVVRLDATRATLGDVYEVANLITDDQSPGKQSEQSFKVQVRR